MAFSKGFSKTSAKMEAGAKERLGENIGGLAGLAGGNILGARAGMRLYGAAALRHGSMPKTLPYMAIGGLSALGLGGVGERAGRAIGKGVDKFRKKHRSSSQ